MFHAATIACDARLIANEIVLARLLRDTPVMEMLKPSVVGAVCVACVGKENNKVIVVAESMRNIAPIVYEVMHITALHVCSDVLWCLQQMRTLNKLLTMYCYNINLQVDIYI